MKLRALFPILLAFAMIAPLHPATNSPRAMQLQDILAWKRILAPIVSSDGQWFAYRLTPNEGDSEVVVRNLSDGKEQRHPIGELAPQAGPSRDLAFSDDAKWAAFLAYPTAKEAKALKKQRKPVESKAVLVELATGKKTEFERIRRFAFGGERSSAIALLRYGANSGAPTPPPVTPPAPGAPNPADDRPQGADLLVYELASGSELNFGNVSDFAFNKPGDWLAWVIDAQDKAGNGIQIRSMVNGAVMGLDAAKASYKGLNWSEQGGALAALRGVEDKAWEEKLYALVAFRDFSPTAAPRKIVFEPAKDAQFPKGMSISPNRNPVWLADLSAVSFGIQDLKPKKNAAKAPDDKAPDETAKTEPAKSEAAKPEPAKPEGAKPDELDKPDLVLWHWKDKRLQAMQQVQETQDKNFSYLSLYRVAEEKFVRLADEALRQVNLQPDFKYAVGLDVRDYERDGNLDGQRYEDVYSIDLATGARKLALKKARWLVGPSPDGSHLLYYDDGAFYTYQMATGQSYNVTRQIPANFVDTENDLNVVKPPTRTIGWSKDSGAVLVTDNWDIWQAPAHGGAGVNLTGNGKKEQIRYRGRYRLDAEEKGIDLAQPMYVSVYGEWTKKGGIGRIEPGKPGARMLTWDDAAYGGLIKAKQAGVYLYTRENSQEYPNYYSANDTLSSTVRVSDANPQQKDFLWNKGVRLIDYTSAKGDKLQAALHLPANYEPGKSYPAVVYIYEKLSQQANVYPHPGYNGFSVSAYTSNGYAVLEPDIVYRVNDPGMSAVWCVLPALKAAIATGIVDSKNVALHGHSWGGYQTAFLVTQTSAFRAAIAGAPLTDMVSMYSSIYWNSGSTNQPIFESSQGRFSGGYWENTEAYIRNSPVYHAKNVTTPLMILHNDKDGAVDWTQGIEYYNTLRRMGKPVVMLEYKGENHNLRKPENMKDYTLRMKEFLDYHLAEKEVPKWLLEGVPLLDMKDHLEEREKLLAPLTAAP